MYICKNLILTKIVTKPSFPRLIANDAKALDNMIKDCCQLLGAKSIDDLLTTDLDHHMELAFSDDISDVFVSDDTSVRDYSKLILGEVIVNTRYAIEVNELSKTQYSLRQVRLTNGINVVWYKLKLNYKVLNSSSKLIKGVLFNARDRVAVVNLFTSIKSDFIPLSDNPHKKYEVMLAEVNRAASSWSEADQANILKSFTETDLFDWLMYRLDVDKILKTKYFNHCIGSMKLTDHIVITRDYYMPLLRVDDVDPTNKNKSPEEYLTPLEIENLGLAPYYDYDEDSSFSDIDSYVVLKKGSNCWISSWKPYEPYELWLRVDNREPFRVVSIDGDYPYDLKFVIIG